MHRLQFSASIFQLLTLQLSEKKLKKKKKKIPSPSPSTHLHSSCISLHSPRLEITLRQNRTYGLKLCFVRNQAAPLCQLALGETNFFLQFFLLDFSHFFLKHTVLQNGRFCVTTSDFSPSLCRNEHQRVGLGLVCGKVPHTYISWYPTPCAVPLVTLHQDFCRQIEVWN